MNEYSTKQRKILLDYFGKHTDECLSTTEIVCALSVCGVSESAVYRNLVALENAGKLRRMSKAGDRKTYYQYIDDEDCRDQIHLSCIRCGRTSHISPSASKRLAKDLKNDDDFIISNGETVIYGICKKCSRPLSGGKA